MLFNSTIFIFVFLPVTVGVFFALAATKRKLLGLGWLITASLVFYAWQEPAWLALLGGSIVANYVVALAIQRAPGARARLWLLILGVVSNLGVLGWFKYAGFAFESLAAFGLLGPAGEGAGFHRVAIPLAISFFTFQQIAYLIETWQGDVRETRFLHYVLFVAFFPKLIAGPIVHHAEIMDQLDAAPTRRFDSADLAVGLTLLSLGLFKKVVLADGIGARATPLFKAAEIGIELSFVEAWVAALAYTFQVYFDFSGYSDMAIGAARCFGIVLPLNFHSPYKATNISEFWRRWHVTLTRWLRLYLFVPISRTLMRRGEAWDLPSVFVAQLVTMLICGLWHGAGWSFVAWGGLHGLLLLGHDGWEAVKARLSLSDAVPRPVGEWLGRVVLLLVLASTFVVFRAEHLSVAGDMLGSMFAPAEITVGSEVAQLAEPTSTWVEDPERAARHTGPVALLHLLGLLLIVWCLPNTQQLLAEHRPALDLRRFGPVDVPPWMRWRPNLAWAGIVVGALGWSVYSLVVDGYEAFVYRFF